MYSAPTGQSFGESLHMQGYKHQQKLEYQVAGRTKRRMQTHPEHNPTDDATQSEGVQGK